MIFADELQVEYLKEPLGISPTNIMLRWIVAGAKKQDGYQVKAVGSKGTVFDSGLVSSTKMQCLIGSFLPKERVTVQIRLLADEKLGESKRTNFECGLEAEDWQANWINPEPTNSKWPQEAGKLLRPASYLKQSFEFIPQTDQQIRLYITSHGIYNIYLNGQRVTEAIFGPGVSQADHLLQYQTYDVRQYLKKGKNEIIISLSDGWWRGTTTFDGIQNGFGSDLALLCQLEVNGQVLIKSDQDWKASQQGPLRFADLMWGEEYDNRIQTITDWHPVLLENFPIDNIEASNCPLPKEHESFSAKLLTTPNGDQVLDFGQNLAGYVSFSLNLPSEIQITLTHGETLDQAGNFTTANFQSPKVECKQQVKFWAKSGNNNYRSTSSFFGFRYVKITGLSKIKPADFVAHAVYTDLTQTGFFECGNQMVNQLFTNALWSFKGNLVDAPTDCPTREKGLFSGDIQIFAHTALYLFNCYSVLQKTVVNQAAGQFADGCVRQIIADPRPQNKFDGAAGWCDSFELLPQAIGDRYNDYRVFERFYPQIKKWLDFVLRRAKKTRLENFGNPYKKYLVDKGMHWGEWLEPGADVYNDMKKIYLHGEPEVATAFLSLGAKALARQAARMGDQAEQESYQTIAENAKQAYRYKFLQQGELNSSRMAVYVRAIQHGLLTPKESQQAAAKLNSLVVANNYQLNTGFLSTNELCRTLSDYGYVTSAYRLLLQTACPSWLFEVVNGATTVWEQWDGVTADKDPQGSLNHYSYGAIVGWLFDSVCGINLHDGKLVIKPLPFKELKYAKAVYQSPFGKIVSSWRYLTDMQLEYVVEVPNNMTAEFVSSTEKRRVLESGEHCWVSEIQFEDSKTVSS
ncbi:MAG: glycoside hydrolase family 78 protein [Liquorilactobacillus nagelii]|jgi:alpha-L-rhamnosidase|uniref:family 78 glycoside hydrolase catalytic domain n=1 Tax=Liquorilactobacillus nagelii TaxID=82688 RepID=UPI002430D8EC|nr:family 78 glycoside hydrolase catalytic domain [Liquorilactobacillus nagelii]MCI1922343.1 glycoside hydrolase family 78 protein [Liquorilactobacillus nagelii]MCI1977785.1 glycoside hydrolase family 78 protein [Liquorilactobacillus nagelii]